MRERPAPPLGTLYLVPVPLGEGDIGAVLPAGVIGIVSRLNHFIVENEKTARRHLKAIGTMATLQALHLAVLDEHTPSSALPSLVQPLRDGVDVGLMSEAGCPAVADPGAALVALAQARGIVVRPLVGPSAILLALMASGLNGQRFAFHGYLPADKMSRLQRIAELEKESALRAQTQMFIETPYRNAALLGDLLDTLQARTRLCVAVDLTLATESVRTQPVAAWRQSIPEINKRPSIFLLLAQ